MAPTPGGAVRLRLPFLPGSAQVARTHLEEWLAAHDQPEEVIEDSRLVVSELIGNAVRHARPLADGTMVVEWRPARGNLDIAVTDGGGPSPPEQLDVAMYAVRGRGLCIVAALSVRWWQETSGARSTMHALLSLPRVRAAS